MQRLAGFLQLPMQMVRPCFLVIDREFPGSISTRKLVIETAKFNVITAYSAHEALETLTQFPAIHGVVIDADIYGMSCDELATQLKKIKPGIPILVISAPGDRECKAADYQVESLDPRKLLEALKKVNPEEVAAIEAQEERLNLRQK
jgi:response regulator RpfG family c-di-GMP phosphodiesterase